MTTPELEWYESDTSRIETACFDYPIWIRSTLLLAATVSPSLGSFVEENS
jgi:hypothetical protein